MTPKSLIAIAPVLELPGKSNEVMVPRGLLTKPCAVEAAKYRPAMAPAMLMLVGKVVVAPGGSNEVMVPCGERTKP